MIYLILLVALLLRLVSIDQSLWLDEATSALVAKMPLKEFFLNFLPADFHPPLYYLILRWWGIIFGYSEIVLRLPSVIFGVLTVYVVYLISKSKTAAIFTAVSGLLIYYSQEARMYSLVTFLVALCFYYFENKRWVLFSIVLMLVGMTDYVALLIVPVFWIIEFKSLKKLFFSHLPLIGFFLIYSPVFISQLTSGKMVEGTNWWNILGTLTIKNILLIPVKFIVGRVTFDNRLLYVVFVLLLSALFGYVLYKAKKAKRIYWLWLITPIVLGIVVSLYIPVLTYFRFIFCLPALYIIMVRAEVPKFVFVSLFVINLGFSCYYLFSPRFHREDWRLASEIISDEKIIFPSNSQHEALIYYNKRENITNLLELTNNDKTVWLGRYVWEIFDPSDSTRIALEKLGYNKSSERNFNGVVFFRYDKNK